MEAEVNSLLANNSFTEVGDQVNQRVWAVNQVQLVRQMVRVHEDELQRMVRDLNNHIGDPVSTIKISIETLRKTLGSNSEALDDLVKMSDALNRLDREIDALARELRSPALYGGLHAAFSEYILSWYEITECEIHFIITGHRIRGLDPEIEIAIFRIFQEVMSNVFKHSKARNVFISVESTDNSLEMIIEDDGVGFDLNQMLNTEYGVSKFGLLGIHERVFIHGGHVNFDSAIGKGTKTRIQIPVARHD